MLKIRNLKVSLEEENKEILKGVNLDINPGSVHAIMGPNGSGNPLYHMFCRARTDTGYQKER